MKIAVTSTDGKTVDQHFGKATQFFVYEIENGILELIEKRNVLPYCETANGEVIDPDHNFNENRFLAVYDQIKDCKVVYTQKIGETPKKKLGWHGIDVQTCNCKVESIIGCGGNCK